MTIKARSYECICNDPRLLKWNLNGKQTKDLLGHIIKSFFKRKENSNFLKKIQEQ